MSGVSESKGVDVFFSESKGVDTFRTPSGVGSPSSSRDTGTRPVRRGRGGGATGPKGLIGTQSRPQKHVVSLVGTDQVLRPRPWTPPLTGRLGPVNKRPTPACPRGLLCTSLVSPSNTTRGVGVTRGLEGVRSLPVDPLTVGHRGVRGLEVQSLPVDPLTVGRRGVRGLEVQSLPVGQVRGVTGGTGTTSLGRRFRGVDRTGGVGVPQRW